MAEPAPSQDTQDEQDSNGMSPGANSDSTGANNAPRPGSVKDRACPFCHQLFTSSSLGRHLDTFIRPKNPKAADGIHDVTEIRKIRGNITRRHARVSSSANKATRQSSVELQRPFQETPTSLRSTQAAQSSHGRESPHSVFRSKADWMVTGVINDLPPRNSLVSASRDAPLSRAGHQESQDPREIEEKEIAKATELALKEVLTSVREAASYVQESSLFEFDFLALNFPALCLKILTPPTTLFSTIPIASGSAWPLDLPSDLNYEEIYRILRERINKRIVENRRKSEDISSTNNNNQREWETEGSILPEAYKPYVEHLRNSYNQWSPLPQDRKHEIWTLELMRALAEQQRKTQALELQVDDAHREVKYLRGEIDSLTHHPAWNRPREAKSSHNNLTGSPAPTALPKFVIKELGEAGVDLRDWDYDRLISKWRENLRTKRRSSNPYQSVSNLSGYEPNYHDSSMKGSSQMDKLADAAAAVEQGRTTPSMGHVLNQGRPQADAGHGNEDVEMRDDDNVQGPKTRRSFARHGAG